MAPNLRAGFPPPPQHPPGKGAPDLSSKAVLEWLKALPVGFPEASAEKMLDRAHEINRLSIPEERRLSFFIGLGRQNHNVLRTLHHKLLDVSTPPRRKEMELAQLVILLHMELALGFRNAIDMETGRKPLPVSRGGLINRALHHMYRCLQAHYLVHLEPGKEIWEKIYALFIIARDGDHLGEAAPTFSGQIAATPREIFKIILLASFSAPQSLRGVQLNWLWNMLPELAPQAYLLPALKKTGPEAAFLIGLNSGRPPRRFIYAEHHRCSGSQVCLEFDATALITEIRNRLRALSQNREGKRAHRAIRISMLKHLASRLSPPRQRPSRFTSQVEVEVIAGFREVHHFLSRKKSNLLTEPPPPVQETRKPAEESRSPIEYNLVLNLELVDIKTQPHFREEKKQEEPLIPATFATEKLDARRAQCRTINFSSSGYSLVVENSRSFNLKVGELVVVREGDKNRWLPGSVVWLNYDGHRLHFGVELLAPFCRPGKALCRQGEETRTVECLVLMEDEQAQPHKILLCPNCVHTGETLTVDCDSNSLELALKRLRAKTQGYAEYECDSIKVQGLEEDTVPLFDAE